MKHASKDILILAGVSAYNKTFRDYTTYAFRPMLNQFYQDIFAVSNSMQLNSILSNNMQFTPALFVNNDNEWNICKKSGTEQSCNSKTYFKSNFCVAAAVPILANEIITAKANPIFVGINNFLIYQDECYKISPAWQEELEKIDVVCISTTFLISFKFLKILCALIKANNKILILGGVLVSMLTYEELNQLPFDYCLKFEAEERFSKLLDVIINNKSKVLLNDIVGLCYKENCKLKFSTAPFAHSNFTKLNFNAKPEFIYGAFSHYESARGCAYKCAFCDFPCSLGTKKYRFKDENQIITDWKNLYYAGARIINIVDATFTTPKKRLVQLFTKLQQQGLPQDLKWSCFARASDLTDISFVKNMKKSGCIYTYIGIESGSQIMLDNMNKKTTVAINKKAIQNCKEVGIYTGSGIIVGFPGETEKTIDETIQFLHENSCDDIDLHPWVPKTASINGNLIPIMQPDNVKKYGIEVNNKEIYPVVNIWGKDITLPIGYDWKHNTMCQAQAVQFIGKISKAIYDDYIIANDNIFGPNTFDLNWSAFVIAQTDYNQHKNFVMKWKSIVKDYCEGLDIAAIKNKCLNLGMI